jgi:hypothetical protein
MKRFWGYFFAILTLQNRLFKIHFLKFLKFSLIYTLYREFPTFYLRCPPKTKISNVASPQEEAVPPLEDLKDF